MAYGFKLTGITIPENTTAINAVISDGTTPTEYALTGSVADGFSGTGISATYSGTYTGEPADIYNDTVIITADMEYDNPIPLSGISQDVIADINTDLETKLAGVSVTINGHAAHATLDGDVWQYVIEEDHGAILKSAYVAALWDEDTNESITGFGFTAGDATYPESVIPGDYTVEIKYPALVSEFDITVDAYTAEDAGDEYTINLSLPEAPTQAFTEALGMAMSPLILHDPPAEFYSIVETTLMSALPDVLAADGKFCNITPISWVYDDATDKESYEEFESEINNIAHHLERAAYCGNTLITHKRPDVYKSVVRFTETNFSAAGYTFIFTVTLIAEKERSGAPRKIVYEGQIATTTTITNT